MLLCGLGLALLYQIVGREYGLFSFAILFAASISIWLLSWFFRKQAAGALLLNVT
jgi:hypothetical protein